MKSDVVQAIFWVLLIITGLAGLCAPDNWPYTGKARFVVVLLLLAILGWRVFVK